MQWLCLREGTEIPNAHKRQLSFLKNSFEVRIHSNICIIIKPDWFKKLDAALIDQLELFSLVASRWIARGLMVDINQNDESNRVNNGLPR